jgi:Trypsin-like peptidase domain
MHSLDELVDPALVRVCDEEGNTVGTAFRVTPEGTLLTCHHVIKDLSEVKVSPDGTTMLDAPCGPDDRFPALDLALLRCPALPGPALPLASDGGSWSTYWTKGFGWQSGSLPGAMPASGDILSNTTSIEYGDEPHYRLPEVLVLAGGSTFDGGLSGAPLLDVDDRAVIGVVNTRYGGSASLDGFAVRIQRAAADEPRLASLLAENRKTVRHLGRHLNALAAVQLCEAQRTVALARLADSGQAATNVYCQRAGVQAAVEEFLDGPARILAVVGPSGTGKTMELAHLASSPPGGDACVLLLGARLSAGRPGLLSALDDELSAVAAAEHWSPLPTTDQLLGALQEPGQELLLLVDALNEVQQHLMAGTWLADTAAWLRGQPVKVIVTCRPEFWQRWGGTLPPELLHLPQTANGQHGRFPALKPLLNERQYQLGDLTSSEAKTALRIYGLSDRGLRPEDVRYPFLLRVYQEAMTRFAVGPLSRFAALELYVSLKCEQIARTLDVRDDKVREVLERIAEALSDRTEARISSAELEELCQRIPRVDDELLSEHVLMRVPGGFRFAFDQVAEYLQAQLLDPATVAPKALRAASGSDRESLGAEILALLQLERQWGAGHLGEALDLLLAKLDTYGGDDARSREDVAFWNLHFLLSEVFRQVLNPQPLLPQLLHYAAILVRHWTMAELFLPALSSPGLPLHARFEVLRVLARMESDYNFRQKDWQRLSGTLSERASVARLVDEELQAHPAEAFALLVPWLRDDHPLRTSHEIGGAEATVADVATALMHRQMDLAPDELFDLLADGVPHTDTALRQLSADRPDVAVEQCERWVATAQPRLMRVAVDCAASALIWCRDPDLRERLLVVANSVATSDVPGAGRHKALLVLMSHPETVLQFADALLERLKAGDPAVKPRHLQVALNRDPERFLPVLLSYFEDHPEQIEDLGSMTRNLALSNTLEERTLRLLVDAYHQGHLSEVGLAMAVEYRCYRVVDNPPTPYVHEVARWMAAHSSPTFRRMMGHVTKAEPKGPGRVQLQQELRSLLERPPTTDH